MAVVKFEKGGQRFSLFEWNDGKQGVARKGQIECCPRSSMPVTILLPSRSVALVVVAVFNAPVVAGCRGGTRFFLGRQAGDEEPGVALLDVGLFFRAPLPAHGYGGASAGEVCVDWRDGRYGTLTAVDASVVAFQAQFKKGESFKAWLAPFSRREVFSLVPTR